MGSTKALFTRTRKIEKEKCNGAMAKFTLDNGRKACSMEMDFGSTQEEKVTKETGGTENLKELAHLSSKIVSTANQEDDSRALS